MTPGATQLNRSASSSRCVVHLLVTQPPLRAQMTGALNGLSIPYMAHASPVSLLQGLTKERCPALILSNSEVRDGSLQVLRGLREQNLFPPAIVIADHHSLQSTVQLMQHGALTVLDRHCPMDAFTVSVQEAVRLAEHFAELMELRRAVWEQMEQLDATQRALLSGILSGNSNRAMALEAGVSERTLERRRADVIAFFGVNSVAQLAWLIGQASATYSLPGFRWPVSAELIHAAGMRTYSADSAG